MIAIPCPACPVGDDRCRGLLHHRDCANVAANVPGYAAMLRRLAGLPSGPTDSSPGDPVVIRAHLHAHGGYGQMTEKLGAALESLRVPVRYEAVAVDESFLPLPAFVRDRIVGPDHGARAVIHALTPESPLPEGRQAIALTMWEATRLRAAHVANLGRAVAVVVPSRWNAEGFAASGVTRPIHVVPLGVDPADYAQLGPPPASGPCVFGVAGRMAHGGSRKGIAETIAAFRAAFPTGQDVRLRVKVWTDCPLGPVDDPRVEVIRRPLTTAEMAEFYRSLTAYATMSRGEGFGLCPLQAMACGRPVLAARYGGHAEYQDDASCYPVAYEEVPADGYYAGCGAMARPDPASMVEQMRRVYRDRGEAIKKGEAAATRAREFCWLHSARKLRDVMEAVGMISAKTRGSLNDAIAPPPAHR